MRRPINDFYANNGQELLNIYLMTTTLDKILTNLFDIIYFLMMLTSVRGRLVGDAFYDMYRSTFVTEAQVSLA